MDDSARLRVELRRSRIAGAVVVVAFTATAALVAWLPASPWARAAIVLALGAYAIALARLWVVRSAKRAIIAIAVGIDRHVTLTEHGGQRIEGIVQDDSYVGAVLTTIVYRTQASRWSRSIAIVLDMLPAEDFRRLRMLLRLGRDSDPIDVTPLPPVERDRTPLPLGEDDGTPLPPGEGQG